MATVGIEMRPDFFRKLGAICGIVVGLWAGAAVADVFYVSQEGNDAWSGRSADRGWFGDKGPFASVERALKAAREVGGRNTILVEAGTYFVREPIRLTAADSGLRIEGPAPRRGKRKARNREELAVLSGGERITGWKETTFNGRRVFFAPAPEKAFRQMWVNGRRAIRARNPDRGYFKIESVPDPTPGWQDGNSRFVFKEGDLGAWDEIDPQARVVVMNRWVESHLPIEAIEGANRVVSFKKRSVWQLGIGDPFYIEGVAELLDAPGEWFLDSRKWFLYYLPLQGETVRDLQVIVPRCEQVLRIEGDLRSGQFVEDLVFRGLSFSHTEWDYPAAADVKEGGQLEPGGAVQAAFTVPGGVFVQGARKLRFEDCGFVHLGTYGLELAEGCRSNRVESCLFQDLAGGGIKIGRPSMPQRYDLTGENEIVGCVLRDGGKVFHSAVGIWIGHSPGNRLLHNDISDFYYTGISIGWSWGYGPAAASNNLVAFNRVHHIGKKSDGDGPILSDMGGIYTLGLQPGTKIINNLWHDIDGLRYGGWGIYFDEGSTGIVAASNVVYRTTHGGFHQHYGASNTVMNNVFAFARDHQIQRTRAEDHISFFFKSNIVHIDQGVFLGGNWNGKFESDMNLYFDARGGGKGRVAFAGKTFEAWREEGHDTNSLFADPGFRDAARGDFTLESGSPALRFGFGAIDVSKVGPIQQNGL